MVYQEWYLRNPVAEWPRGSAVPELPEDDVWASPALQWKDKFEPSDRRHKPPPRYVSGRRVKIKEIVEREPMAFDVLDNGQSLPRDAHVSDAERKRPAPAGTRSSDQERAVESPEMRQKE
ncbi:hypothetical protein Q5752_005419 [Cryptotrichosporon argae]